jgi:putative oxidoreductase
MTATAQASDLTIAMLVRRTVSLMGQIPYAFLALICRVSIAAVFWQSGETKLDGWQVSDMAVELFRNEYRLPLIDPSVAAHLAAFAEHFFPALLVLGLGTRFAALALLVMTLIIEIFVYPDAWPTHGTWAACFLLLMRSGAGVFSLDHLIARRFG